MLPLSPMSTPLFCLDRADSLNQFAKLISDLDSNMNDKLTIIPLRHVDAKRMMDLLSSLTGSGSALALVKGKPGRAVVWHHQVVVSSILLPTLSLIDYWSKAVSK